MQNTEVLKKMIVTCPKCEERGLSMHLCQIIPVSPPFPLGGVAIKRFDENQVTVIEGRDFSVSCGLCGETVLRKEADVGTVVHFRESWISRVEIGGAPGTVGAHGS